MRLAYAAVTCAAIAAGLATRMLGDQLPDFIALHFGDALWACMIYFGLRLIWPYMRKEWTLICSLLFCMAIEFSQLYQAEWIQTARETAIGGLVLGHGFLPVDLVRYGAGVLFAYGADRLISYVYKFRK